MSSVTSFAVVPIAKFLDPARCSRISNSVFRSRAAASEAPVANTYECRRFEARPSGDSPSPPRRRESQLKSSSTTTSRVYMSEFLNDERADKYFFPARGTGNLSETVSEPRPKNEWSSRQRRSREHRHRLRADVGNDPRGKKCLPRTSRTDVVSLSEPRQHLDQQPTARLDGCIRCDARRGEARFTGNSKLQSTPFGARVSRLNVSYGSQDEELDSEAAELLEHFPEHFRKPTRSTLHPVAIRGNSTGCVEERKFLMRPGRTFSGATNVRERARCSRPSRLESGPLVTALRSHRSSHSGI